MLTDLNWLNSGALYPPVIEKERIQQYKTNEQLFLSNHPDVWKDDFMKIARRLHKKDFEVTTVLNYQQLLSKKTADFVCGEPPTIETEGSTDELLKLLQKQNFFHRLYEAFIDISRYGNAVLKFVGKSVTAVSPLYWFPIVSPADLKTVSMHVIAYPITPDPAGIMTQLYAEIHHTGEMESRIYAFDGQKQKIGKLLESKKEKTNIDNFAVHILTNVTHSGSIYGIDDYSTINSIVQRIMWRLHCADSILDKHSEPSISGPATALEYDQKTGMHFLNLGNYFKRNTTTEPDIQYITWDGNLESNFKEIEMLFNQLYTLTEMGQAFMEGGGGGEASSGTALKLRMVSPRIKAARLVSINSSCIKILIALLAYINGITLDYDTITIKWNDGLPIDEVEQVNTLVSATGGKPIMSQYAALKARGFSDGEVEAELEQIREESAANVPLVLQTIDRHTGGEDGES